MDTTQTPAPQALENMAKELAAREILVETNDGTYSQTDAHRATGSGDPKHNTYRVYAAVGGGVRHVGCAKEKAPGRARYFARAELSGAQKKLAALRAEIFRSRGGK